MLLLLKLFLEPLNSGKLVYTGRFIRATFLKIVSSIDESFSEKLHEPNKYWGTAPYSITPIYGENLDEEKFIPLNTRVEKDKIYCFEIRIVQSVFESILVDLIEKLYESLKLGNISFEVAKILLKKSIVKDENANRFEVFFRTPTYFRILGSDFHYLFPTPEKLVFSVAKILNIFSIESFDKDFLENEVIPNISIKAYNLRTVKPVPLDRSRRLIGFVGRVVYEASDKKAAEVFGKILNYAKYTNVGGNRTGGFGVVNYKVVRD